MTMITVSALAGRLSREHRQRLALALTDAVLVPEVGQMAPPARIGFQVKFVEHAADMWAVGGRLVADLNPSPDVMHIDIAVMNASWPQAVRTQVLKNVFQALAESLEVPEPSATWWVNFRIIDEGSWGSRGDVLSILDLLDTGVFSESRAAEIRQSVERDKS